MPVKILADENVNYNIIKFLRKEKFSVISILENYSGVSDKDVLNIALKENCILLTEDSDFGELIFSTKNNSNSVIFIRYYWKDIEKIIKSLLFVLNSKDLISKKQFITLSVNKIRTRDI